MKIRLTKHGDRLLTPSQIAQARYEMLAHLWADHGQQVYIGNPFEIHTEDHPRCAMERPIFRTVLEGLIAQEAGR